MTYTSRSGSGSTGVTILIVIVAVIAIIFTIGNSVKVGSVDGKPYSLKQTSAVVIGAGNWIYYDEDGQEKPLHCSRFITVTCDSEDGRVHFTATTGKNNVITFPSITIDGEPQNINCAARIVGTECLTTFKTP